MNLSSTSPPRLIPTLRDKIDAPRDLETLRETVRRIREKQRMTWLTRSVLASVVLVPLVSWYLLR